MIICYGSTESSDTRAFLSIRNATFRTTDCVIETSPTDAIELFEVEVQVLLERCVQQMAQDVVAMVTARPKNWRWYHRFTYRAQPRLPITKTSPVGVAVRRTQDFKSMAQRNAAKRRARIQALRRTH